MVKTTHNFSQSLFRKSKRPLLMMAILCILGISESYRNNQIDCCAIDAILQAERLRLGGRTNLFRVEKVEAKRKLFTTKVFDIFSHTSNTIKRTFLQLWKRFLVFIEQTKDFDRNISTVVVWKNAVSDFQENQSEM